MFAVIYMGCTPAAGNLVTFTALTEPSSLAALPLIPWSGGGDAWQQAAPLFTATNAQNGMCASGWAAATPAALLLRFTVQDTTHVSAPPDTPWAGDGIELCLDARGDGTRTFPTNRPGCYGRDDMKFMLCLTGAGAQITRSVAGDGSATGLPLTNILRGAHDPVQRRTRYDVRLPWALLQTEPGLLPTLGMAVQFNNLEPGMRDKEILQWGGGTFGPFCPGLFSRVALAAPPGPFCAAAFGETVLWDAQATADAMIAYRTTDNLLLQVQLGTNIATQSLPAGAGVTRLRLAMQVPPTDADAVPARLCVISSAHSAALAACDAMLEFPAAAYRALVTRFDALIPTAEPPLLRRHLLSCRALLISEWQCLMLQRASVPDAAALLFANIKSMREGIAGDAATWPAYRDGTRDLILAYVSPTDRSLQYYQLGLPRAWDSARAYPLFFELHGSGDPRPIAGVAAQLGGQAGAATFRGQSARVTFASLQGHGYHCAPFGRGNQGYRGIGEVDIWEAYDDVHAQCVIDPARRYLYGFSMGGGGTWSIGTRTPDRWAALAILSGGLWREKSGLELGQNIAHLPIFIWCGESDSLFENVARLQGALTRFGATPVVRTTPGLGHVYRGDIQEEVINWLQQFTRTRPATFSFVADTDEHPGTWGITMARDARITALPRFTCQITNQLVRIDSSGTPGLEVRAGSDGLGLTGAIAIIWNGVTAYQGPATTVQLGQPVWHPQR